MASIAKQSDLIVDEREISAALVTARMAASALQQFPGRIPNSLERAYLVQEHSIRAWPDTVAGWKAGGIAPALREPLGANWLVGPIFKRSVRKAADGVSTAMPVFDGGFAAVEPEFIVQLGEQREADRLFIGVEIASSPVPAINDYGPTAVICDFGNNNGLLVGAEFQDWAHAPEPIEVSAWIDGELAGTRVVEDLRKDVMSARDFCIAHAKRRGAELQPGTLISTGAITGIHEANVGARCTIRFGKVGGMELELVSALPAP